MSQRIRGLVAGCVLLCAGVFAFAQSPLAQIGVKEQQARAWILGKVGAGCPCTVYAAGDPEVQAALDAFKKLPPSARGTLTTQLYAWVKALTASPSFRADYQQERERRKPRPTEYSESPEQELKNRIQKESDDREQSIKYMESSGMKEQAAQLRKEWPEQLKQLTAIWRNEISEGRKKDSDEYIQGVKNWETRIPADLNLTIAHELRDFVATTADVDFAAKKGPVLNGREYNFLNPAYWDKPWQWQLSWEWGPEAIAAARTAAAAWLKELGK